MSQSTKLIMMKENEILRVNNLKKYFPVKKGFFSNKKEFVKAIDDISFSLFRGETLGIVGESGCGKTTLGRCIIKVMDPTDGQILVTQEDKEIDLAPISNIKDLKLLRNMMNMIIQDPYHSLNPRFTVLDIISEPMIYKGASKQQRIDRVKELMPMVGLKIEHLLRFPHAFSGGQRQRIGIARALAVQPEIIICDEAVSALDVSIQAQILNLLMDIQDEYKIAYLFISHDLSVIEHISDRVAVLYVGKLIELADTNSIFSNPKHPYTEALLSSTPNTDNESKRERIHLKGEVASPITPPRGCYFHPRCGYAKDICKHKSPELVDNAKGHMVACHFSDDLELKGINFGNN